MKRALLICFCLLGIIGLMFALYRAIWSVSEEPSRAPVTFPTSSTDPTQVESERVKAAFRAQILAPIPTLGRTVIAGDYALQSWSGTIDGGEAILAKKANGEWDLLDIPSGGAWDIDSLVLAGIPRGAAEALIAARDR